MSAESTPQTPVAIDRDVLEEIASERGIQPTELGSLLTEFQEHWVATDFLEDVATPHGARPGMWYLTVPGDDWETHIRGLDIESYEWLAVRDIYSHIYQDWASSYDATHTLAESESPVILGTDDPKALELSVPTPNSPNAVADEDTEPPASDSTDDDPPEGAVAEGEWEIRFGLPAMEYGTHARGTATLTGPSGTLSVRRDCYGHPRTETGESETPPGMIRLETTRTHDELNEALPTDPETVPIPDADRPGSLAMARNLVDAHVELLGEDYTALVESVDICTECGAIPAPADGVYVETIPALDGAYCWECFGEAVGDSDTIRISKRQGEARFLRAVGLSYGAIGKMLGVRDSSVTTHLDRAEQSRKKARDTMAVFDALESIDSRETDNDPESA